MSFGDKKFDSNLQAVLDAEARRRAEEAEAKRIADEAWAAGAGDRAREAAARERAAEIAKREHQAEVDRITRIGRSVTSLAAESVPFDLNLYPELDYRYNPRRWYTTQAYKSYNPKGKPIGAWVVRQYEPQSTGGHYEYIQMNPAVNGIALCADGIFRFYKQPWQDSGYVSSNGYGGFSGGTIVNPELHRGGIIATGPEMSVPGGGTIATSNALEELGLERAEEILHKLAVAAHSPTPVNANLA